MLLHIGRFFPFRLPGLVEPSVQSGFHDAMILMPGQTRNEPNERAPGDDAHNRILSCSQNGHKWHAETETGLEGIGPALSPSGE